MDGYARLGPRPGTVNLSNHGSEPEQVPSCSFPPGGLSAPLSIGRCRRATSGAGIKDQDWKPQYSKLQKHWEGNPENTADLVPALQDSLWHRPVFVAPRHTVPCDPELESLYCCHSTPGHPHRPVKPLVDTTLHAPYPLPQPAAWVTFLVAPDLSVVYFPKTSLADPVYCGGGSTAGLLDSQDMLLHSLLKIHVLPIPNKHPQKVTLQILFSFSFSV